MSKPLVLVGAGRMGAALARGWIAAGRGRSLIVIEPHPDLALAREVKRADGKVNPDKSIIPPPAAVVLAVKPQMMEPVAREAARFADVKPLFISIAAGISLQRLSEWLGSQSSIVRAMPNLPASIGHGITVAIGNARVSTVQKKLAGSLLGASGVVEWISNEAEMNAVTALSGSGPAYVFHLVEAMAAAGVRAGLDEVLAMRLARQTVIGAGALMEISHKDVAVLRSDVTSPGGTTEAALEKLMGRRQLEILMTRAISAATARAGKLGR